MISTHILVKINEQYEDCSFLPSFYDYLFDQNDENCFGDYFNMTTPISSSLDSQQSSSQVDFLCNEMVNFLDHVNDTAWSLVYNGKDSQEFINASSQVVNTLLCQGMLLFNGTLWEVVKNSNDPTFICNAPARDVPCITDWQPEVQPNTTFQSAMDSLLGAYNNKYKQIIQPVVECIESYANDQVTDKVFSGATSSLQNTAIETTEASWATLFLDPAVVTATDFDFNEQMENWIGNATSPEVAKEVVGNSTIFNHTQIANHISHPALTSSPDIVQLEGVAMSLVDSFFVYINDTLMDLYAADTSNLTEIPPYATLPYLGINSLCQDIWGVKQNTSILIETIESTPDDYCRAHVTACTKTGICLLGLDYTLNKVYLPYKFIGPLCYDYKNGLDEIMKMKDELGLLDSYVPDQGL